MIIITAIFIGFLVKIVLLVFIIGGYKGLKLSNDEVISGIETSTQKHLTRRSIITIGSLIFVQWVKFGSFGYAELEGASLIMYIIIIYEVIGDFAMLFFRKGYVNELKWLARNFPLLLRLPVIGIIIFLCYLFVKDVMLDLSMIF
ncbi:MAG: hypothetical protein HY919_04150 [Elusimicrobia bacterium]|nr:hypothetical protein [Elusimicrobiota bacterium]